jgi:hypothetical protein
MFQAIKGQVLEKTVFTRASRCDRPPPSKPNVYSDGSFTNPRYMMFGLAGIGVWWPERNIIEKKLNEREAEMGWEVQKENGCAIHTSLAGYGGSSTRAEIAAGTLAISADGPIHLATDSQAFMDKAESLIRLAHQGLGPKRPFELQTDGDIWSTFWETVHQKGPSSIKISKVKGHATDEEVREGKVKAEDKVGNDAADKAADVGNDLHGKGTLKAANYFSQRSRLYGLFIKDLHNHIIEATLLKQVMLKEKLSKEKKDKGTLPKMKEKTAKAKLMTDYAEEENTEETDMYRRLSGMIPADQLQAEKTKFPKLKEVQDFIGKIEVAENMMGKHGTTYLELYTLYKLIGNCCMVEQPVNNAKARTQMAKQLKQFQKHVQRLQQCSMSIEDAKLFEPSKKSGRPLARLGIASSMPSINCEVHFGAIVRKVIDMELLRAKGGTKKEAKRTVEEGGQTTLKKIDLSNKHSWSKSICRLSSKTDIWQGRQAEEAVKKREIEGSKQLTDKEFFQCQRCQKWSKVNRKAFDTTTLDASAKCSLCKKTSLVMRWRCKCSCEWHECTTHRESPGIARTSRPAANAPQAKRLDTKIWQEVKAKGPQKMGGTLWKNTLPEEEIVLEDKGKRKMPMNWERLPLALKRRLNYTAET